MTVQSSAQPDPPAETPAAKPPTLADVERLAARYARRRAALTAPEESLFRTGDEYLRGMVMLAGAWMMGATALATAGAVLYNLVAELAGGIEFTVFEEVPAAGGAEPAGGGAEAQGGR